jgi:formate-dependent nitrite reductase membrane component NrfD
MQACPYDALYIDPSTRTAAKCNYCAHRVEVGLEPACVIVCPEQAIVAGDLDDPGTRIARLIGREQVQVRKAEQGTRPKVFYLGADAGALTPELQAPAEQYLWAQRPAAEMDLVRLVAAAQAGEDRAAGALTRPVYDVPHAPRPWGWKVAAYLWTKSLAAGALLVGALGVLSGGQPTGFLLGRAAPLLALAFLLATAALLVLDLRRPERFLYIVLKPNPRSWLVWGAWVLFAYGAVAGLWLLAALAGNATLVRLLALPAFVLAAATAGYSAFLFGQAEGRDFWQSPLLLPQLLVGAEVAGSGLLLVAGFLGRVDVDSLWSLGLILISALSLQLLVLAGELLVAHANADAARAARLITRGPWRLPFWGGVVSAGNVLPILLVWANPHAAALGAALALAGLWLYEDVWVKAGQSVPLS